MLYDTFGFPLEITQELASLHGILVRLQRCNAYPKLHFLHAPAVRALKTRLDLRDCCIALCCCRTRSCLPAFLEPVLLFLVVNHPPLGPGLMLQQPDQGLDRRWT